MAEDPYSVLGVSKTASQADITKAYRKLAKKLHPDLNPGDKAAEEKFKTITAAYDIVGDEEKRGRFDRGEIDASGPGEAAAALLPRICRRRGRRALSFGCGLRGHWRLQRPVRRFVRAGRWTRGTRRWRWRTVFNARTGRAIPTEIGFLDAVNGTKTRITLPDGATLDVTIPRRRQ